MIRRKPTNALDKIVYPFIVFLLITSFIRHAFAINQSYYSILSIQYSVSSIQYVVIIRIIQCDLLRSVIRETIEAAHCFDNSLYIA